LETTSVPVRELLDRIRAEVLVLNLWDERRLAYDIKGRRRGMYVLTYFKAEPADITALDHEVQIDERILRAMVLSADHVSEDRMNVETPAMLSRARRAAAEAEKDRKAERTAERRAAATADKPAQPPEAGPAEAAPAAPADQPQAPADGPDEKAEETQPPEPQA